MSQGVAGFFGIPDEDKTEQQRRQNEWKERSRRMHSGSMFLRGHKVDQTDAVSTAASVVRRFFLEGPVWTWDNPPLSPYFPT